jgi:hypothetical protein
MRVTNSIPLGCSLPLTGWHGKLRPHTELKVNLDGFAFVFLTMNSVTTPMTSHNTEGQPGWVASN